jgi:cytochrome P450
MQELQKLSELQHCVNETLRMYPPLIMLMRMALKDIEYEGEISFDRFSSRR